MIRQATADDILDVVMLAKQFHKELKPPYRFDREFMMQQYQQAISYPRWFIWVAVVDDDIVGFLGAVTAPTLFSVDLQAVELGWFMEKGHRDSREAIALLIKYEQWAKAQGCKTVNMGNLAKLSDLTPLYERRGYQLYERTFLKDI